MYLMHLVFISGSFDSLRNIVVTVVVPYVHTAPWLASLKLSSVNYFALFFHDFYLVQNPEVTVPSCPVARFLYLATYVTDPIL